MKSMEQQYQKEINTTYNKTTHPHIGEPGIYHVKQRGEKIAKGKLITFGTYGENQNCGKTTLFNQLTGANQHVETFPELL